MSEQVSSNGTEERPAHKASFPTLEAAKLVKAPSDNFRVFTVTDDDGKQVYAWGQSGDNAIAVAARAAGWKAESAEPKGAGPLTKEKISSALAAMSDEDRAILIAQYVPAPAPVISPAPVKGKGRK